ncbi:IclR family transcriptional regulator domain-containing protein [Zafaria sp. Z1313]|uniref:IclR family transcriptional regulator domain-containing protein n=1 Tax=unclassified Zafaria TaxID=2828765 RepID=UPI002E78B0AF|nr:IclR family transcriptional regulator C-terminal domain-containing protein [Zafaria sp. J156]MEE1619828.1 IclR family transcriptional regulator C-terminal domain-containing protein [Zafaria sp. J156]
MSEGIEPGNGHYYVKSAEKTLSVLLAFTAAGSALSVTQVAEATDLSRAAARRFLLTLTDLGYLSTDGTLFRQTPRVLDIGAGYLAGLSLPRVAERHLAELAHRLDETATLSVLDGQDVLYIARVAAPRLHTVTLNIGNRLPAWVTSMGRVLIASLPEPAREEFLAGIVPQEYTSHTIRGVDELRAELDVVRRRGWSLVDQELDEGLRGIAVPVMRGGDVLAALNISIRAGRSAKAAVAEELVPALQAAAVAIADDFGGRSRAVAN